MSEWRKYFLEELTEPIKETYKPTGTDDYHYIGLEHIEQESLRFTSIGHSTDVTSNKFRFNSEDVLFGKLRPYFRKVVKPNFPGICSTDIWVLRAKDGFSQDFLFYFLANWDFVDTASGGEGGTRMPRADWNFLRQSKWLIPHLPEQKAIASILSSLDDKIDLLHRQNKTLETIAETLFRQWFIEDVEGDREEGTIADLIDFNPLRKLPKGSVAPYLEMAALSNSTFNPLDWYDRPFASGTKFINGDTLLARITPCLENGKTAYITFLENDQVAWGSTEYIVMRPKDDIHSFFAYTLAKNSDFRDYAEGCLEGSSGRQRVNIDHLKNYEIKIPPASLVNDFNMFAESIVPKLTANSRQILILEKLRDTLLPKLMSGEVRVTL